MIFNIITLFPEIFPGPLNHSLSGKALNENKLQIITYDLRKFSKLKNKKVDDTPFGGGPGMIIRADIVQNALDFVKKTSKKPKTIFLSPGGKTLCQKKIREIVNFKDMIIICGRYEGIDQRFLDHNKIEEISIGDYILSGGELAAIILIDTCVRLIPEVLGNNKSLINESFENNLLEYPQYTKPRVWKNLSVPEPLLSGNHELIKEWRYNEAKKKTKLIRPDLWKKYIDFKEKK